MKRPADALALAGAPGAAADLGFGPALASARLKIEACLPAAMREAEDAPRRFHLDPVDWYRRRPAPDGLPALADAVWSRRVVEIDYDSWKGVVARRLHSLGGVLKGGTWYLAAAADGQARVYRIDQIQTFTVTDDPAADLPGFDLARFWTDWVEAFEARLKSGRARLRLTAEGLRRLRIVEPMAAADLPDMVPGTMLEAEVPIESLNAAVDWLCWVGPEVEALSPPELRAAVVDRARALIDLDGDSGPETVLAHR